MPVRNIHPQTKACLDREIARGYEFVRLDGFAYVDVARGLLAHRINQALVDTDIDVIAFIDEDMRWTAHNIDRLTYLCRVLYRDAKMAPLLHATYARRGDTGQTCHTRIVSEEPCKQPRDLLVQLQTFPAVVGGLGFCAIHREGFLRFADACDRYRVTSVAATAIDMFPSGVIDGQFYGEDVLHCLRQFHLGDGSYWAQPMVVEHMASTYGPALAPRLPSPEALAELSGVCPPPQGGEHYEQHCEHAPD